MSDYPQLLTMFQEIEYEGLTLGERLYEVRNGKTEPYVEIHAQAIADYVAALKREIESLLSGIRSARHCLTHGRNTTPTEGERFDIGTTYTKLSMLLLTAEEQDDAQETPKVS